MNLRHEVDEASEAGRGLSLESAATQVVVLGGKHQIKRDRGG